MNNTQLMSVSDILNAAGLAGVLFYLLTPTIIFIVAIYIIRRIILRSEICKKGIKIQRENARKLADAKTADELGNILSNEAPKNYEKYFSLTLEFNEKGRVKQ